jgi:hypothetical protein
VYTGSVLRMLQKIISGYINLESPEVKKKNDHPKQPSNHTKNAIKQFLKVLIEG